LSAFAFASSSSSACAASHFNFRGLMDFFDVDANATRADSQCTGEHNELREEERAKKEGKSDKLLEHKERGTWGRLWVEREFVDASLHFYGFSMSSRT
jgi:hypothetical protein